MAVRTSGLTLAYSTETKGERGRMLSTTFLSFLRIPVPSGSSSVGVDITLLGFKYAFGIPEHADGLSLRSTV